MYISDASFCIGEASAYREPDLYLELNAPVEHQGRRGWLNVAHWGGGADALSFTRSGKTVRIEAPFLKLEYTGVGIEGGCPAERDNCGCFFRTEDGWILRPPGDDHRK